MRNLPKFLLGWWFNKPILMNSKFETILASSSYSIPPENRDTALIDNLLNDSQAVKKINKQIKHATTVEIPTECIRWSTVDQNGNIKLEVIIPPTIIESRGLFGKFEESISKWEYSINARKLEKL